jgi:hypothetical protein
MERWSDCPTEIPDVSDKRFERNISNIPLLNAQSPSQRRVGDCALRPCRLVTSKMMLRSARHRTSSDSRRYRTNHRSPITNHAFIRLPSHRAPMHIAR